LLERDRAAVAFCILLVVGLAWGWLWHHASMGMDHAVPPLAFLFVMWWIMMVAMMLPSAAPMILLFSTVSRRSREQGQHCVPTAVFALAYLAVWGGFSVLAASLQWWIEARGVSSPWMNGALLLGAGAYQLTPLKDACLRQCRSPLNFVMTRWRPGWRGALRMGIEHGAYCLGCCWLLMGLLFVGGVMNLWWVIGIAVYVLLEKVLPAGLWLGRALGAILAVAGAFVLLHSTS
jgi:predicted metal-binding membrane protein